MLQAELTGAQQQAAAAQEAVETAEAARRAAEAGAADAKDRFEALKGRLEKAVAKARAAGLGLRS